MIEKNAKNKIEYYQCEACDQLTTKEGNCSKCQKPLIKVKMGEDWEDCCSIQKKK